MQPAPFDYECAGSVAEAVELLGAGDARLIAGGQSLVPMMSLGLAAPAAIVDIGMLELAGLEARGDVVRVGALTRHRELERGGAAAALLPLAAEAARHVGNPRVRNRGTFGGSLSHADPAAELCAVALAHGGEAVAQGPSGERRVALDDFFQGYFETALQEREVLVAVDLDRPPAGSGTAFVELAQRADDFAVAGAAAIVTPSADGASCAAARVAVLGVGGAAQRLTEVEGLCAGAAIDERLLTEARAAAAAAIAPEDDPFVSAAYRRRVAAACVSRAIQAAWRRTGGAER